MQIIDKLFAIIIDNNDHINKVEAFQKGLHLSGLQKWTKEDHDIRKTTKELKLVMIASQHKWKYIVIIT